jgi:hypothetical protein
MYFKGCDNSTVHESIDATKAFRDGWNRIFGNKDDVGIIKFPSGKGVFDDKTKTWVDREEYKKMNREEHKPTFLIQVDNPTPLEYTKSTRASGTKKEMLFKKLYK